MPRVSARRAVLALAVALVSVTGCNPRTPPRTTEVRVDDAPPMIAESGTAPASLELGDGVLAVRVHESRCYRLEEGRRVGERVRDFFAYSLVDQEALEHYRREFGHPTPERSPGPASASDEDVICEYVPAAGRDFTLLVDDEPVGLYSTDSQGYLRLDASRCDPKTQTIVAIDTATGTRVVVSSPEDVDVPGFTVDAEVDDAEIPGAIGQEPAGRTVDDDDRGTAGDVDFSDVPPGSPFDDEGPFDDGAAPGGSQQ